MPGHPVGSPGSLPSPESRLRHFLAGSFRFCEPQFPHLQSGRMGSALFGAPASAVAGLALTGFLSRRPLLPFRALECPHLPQRSRLPVAPDLLPVWSHALCPKLHCPRGAGVAGLWDPGLLPAQCHAPGEAAQ